VEIHIRKNKKTVASLLARITGEPIVRTGTGTYPLYDQTVPEPNRSALLAFYRSLVTEEISVGRIGVLLGNMYRISIWLKHKPFGEVTQGDVIDLVEHIRNIRENRKARKTLQTPYSPQTVESYKMTIKKFWRWLKNPGLTPDVLRETEYPPEVSWIRHKKAKNGLLPKDIWTPEEVNTVASMVSNERDRAFILGLFGSGCRIGEFLPLKREDIIFDKYSAQILVDGKTGSRRIRLTPAASLSMAAWLDVHPNKAPDAPVWVNIQIRHKIPDERLGYDWARAMLRELAKRAGINKPINPHLMRHSLATYYAPRLTEAVMNEHFGWRQGGRTAATYTHLSGKQVDDQILAVFGKKQVDPVSNKAVDIVRCQRCGLENAPTSVQCGKCGFPLSDEAARTLCERREKADELMNILVEQPEFKELVRRLMTRSP